MKKRHIILIAAMAALLLAGCAAHLIEEDSPEKAAMESAGPVTTPSPTPIPEPELPTGVSVTVDGTELSGSVVSGNVSYVPAERNWCLFMA